MLVFYYMLKFDPTKFMDKVVIQIKKYLLFRT
jgi:hypothetical protein